MSSDVAVAVRRARERAGLSQRGLAARAGLPPSTVGRIERGAVEPRWDTLRAMATALGATVEVAFTPNIPDWLAPRVDQLLAVCARHGALGVAVFGSTAVGTAESGSDLDLLVDLSPEADLLSLVRLERELSELLGVSVDVVPRETLGDGFVVGPTIPLSA